MRWQTTNLDIFLQFDLFVCFDSFSSSQPFSVMSGRVFLGLTSTKQRIMCLAHLAQGHN